MNNIKRCCIFIDGENFRHSICDLFESEFKETDYLPEYAEWGLFFDWLAEKASKTPCERVRAYWYVSQYIDFNPYLPKVLRENHYLLKKELSKSKVYESRLEASSGAGLEEELKAILKELDARKDEMRKRFEGWTTIQNGISRKHDSIEFRRAGGIPFDLYKWEIRAEKAVDVKLATDLIVLRDSYDIAVIVAGDQDYVPAVQYVKDTGKRVINVSFNTRSGKLLPGGAWRLNLLTDWRFVAPYDDVKRFLHIGTPGLFPG
jgi:uncharacterized LabA/DUF88 family protein